MVKRKEPVGDHRLPGIGSLGYSHTLTATVGYLRMMGR